MTATSNTRRRALGVGAGAIPKAASPQPQKRLISIRLIDYDRTIARLRERMALEGYTPRTQSKWISEAIIEFWSAYQRENPDDLGLYIELLSPPKAGDERSLRVTLQDEGLETFNALTRELEAMGKGSDASTRIITIAILMRLRMAPRPR